MQFQHEKASMMDLLFKAVDFAQKVHFGQYRKARKVPYIVHPLGVMEILSLYTDDEELLAAAILHDVVEDTPTTVSDIYKNFGSRVAFLVNAVSEQDKKDSWENRKREALHSLSSVKEEEILMLSCADKLHNLRSIEEDRNMLGEKIWDRFKRGKEQQAWFFSSCARIYTRFNPNNPLFKEYEKAVNNLFFPKGKEKIVARQIFIPCLKADAFEKILD